MHYIRMWGCIWLCVNGLCKYVIFLLLVIREVDIFELEGCAINWHSSRCILVMWHRLWHLCLFILYTIHWSCRLKSQIWCSGSAPSIYREFFCMCLCSEMAIVREWSPLGWIFYGILDTLISVGNEVLFCLVGVFQKWYFYNWLVVYCFICGFKLQVIFLKCQVMVWHYGFNLVNSWIMVTHVAAGFAILGRCMM